MPGSLLLGRSLNTLEYDLGLDRAFKPSLCRTCTSRPTRSGQRMAARCAIAEPPAAPAVQMSGQVSEKMKELKGAGRQVGNFRR